MDQHVTPSRGQENRQGTKEAIQHSDQVFHIFPYSPPYANKDRWYDAGGLATASQEMQSIVEIFEDAKTSKHVPATFLNSQWCSQSWQVHEAC